MENQESVRLKEIACRLAICRDEYEMPEEVIGTLTAEINELNAIIDNQDTTPEQQHEINRADLKELKDYYGGWDELRKVIYDIEGDEAEASYDSFVNDFYGSDKPVTLDEQHQAAYKEKYNPK